MIPYGRQEILEEDIQAVVDVLKSDYLTQGPVGPQFENQMSVYCGATYGIAVCNGTAALHLACLALGVGPGDLVWTSDISFVASANCARYCGAKVDFVDIDKNTLNISIPQLATKLQIAEREGRLPKVVIPVHFAGRCCDMDAIGALSQKYGFRIIEDACHALGAHDHVGRKVGSCRFSDLVVTSFHPVKMITTGEGGMILTCSEELAARLALLRSHGITRDESKMESESDGPWFYQQVALGYNYRMTDIQAALGLSQLNRLPKFLEQRREVVKRYRDRLSAFPVVLPFEGDDEISAWHLFVVRVPAQSRRQIFEAMRNAGVGVNVHYIPIHQHPDFARLGFQVGQFKESELYYSEAISLPIFPSLSVEDQDTVVSCLRRSLTEAGAWQVDCSKQLGCMS